MSYTDAEGEKHTDTPMTVDDALAIEGTAENPVTVSLFGNTVLTRDATVHPYTTLILPYKDGDTIGNNRTDLEESPDKIEPILRFTLTLKNGVALTVNGDLIIGAITGAKITAANQNAVSGSYNQIVTETDTVIIVENNGSLTSYGYIKGSGAVIANGGKIVDLLTVTGWKGGSASGALYTGAGSMLSATTREPQIFPFHNYQVRNIEVPITLNFGAEYSGYTKIFTEEKKVSFITLPAQFNEAYFPFVGSEPERVDSGMFILQDKESSIVKSLKNGRVKFDLYGNITDGVGALSIKIYIVTLNASTEKVYFPIDGLIDIIVNDGANLTVRYKHKLMPGAVVNVAKGGVMTLDGKIIVYTGEWQDSNAVAYPSGRGDASFIVDGTLNINGAFGGNIKSNENGKIYIAEHAELTDIYSKEGKGGSSGTSFTFEEKNSVTKSLILIGNAANINSPQTGTTYIYNSVSGEWQAAANN